MGFGTELLFVLMLGLVVLGPKRLHTLLGQVGRAKAEFDKATRGFKSQLAAQLDGAPTDLRNASETLPSPVIDNAETNQMIDSSGAI